MPPIVSTDWRRCIFPPNQLFLYFTTTKVIEKASNYKVLFNNVCRLAAAPLNCCKLRAFYVYYCNQGNTPYDPEGAKAGAATVKNTANIGDLITELPDYLEVNLKNNQINVKNEYYTVQLGRDYHVDADYSVFVPFEFDRGLKVVYNDSTESMHSDLKDLSATGTLEVMADAYNTIPLELLVGLKAVDVDGNEVPVEFNTAEAHVAPGDGSTYTMNGEVKQRSGSEVMTPIKITAKLDDKDLLSRIDKLCFNIHADATGSNKLVSTQYLKLNNIKIKLHAGVIADFN